MSTLTSEVTVTNPQGLHARPAAELVELMKSLDANVTINVGEKTAKANSIMSVLALGASTGAVATIEAEGPDAEKAIDAVTEILRSDD